MSAFSDGHRTISLPGCAGSARHPGPGTPPPPRGDGQRSETEARLMCRIRPTRVAVAADPATLTTARDVETPGPRRAIGARSLRLIEPRVVVRNGQYGRGLRVGAVGPVRERPHAHDLRPCLYASAVAGVSADARAAPAARSNAWRSPSVPGECVRQVHARRRSHAAMVRPPAPAATPATMPASPPSRCVSIENLPKDRRP